MTQHVPDPKPTLTKRTIVMVTGAAPGLGKSTLVAALAAAFAREGDEVSRFLESEISGRPEFAGVMSAFRTTGVASIRQLLDASAAYLTTVASEDVEIVVQDMLFPYLPSLLAWGHSDDEILEFCHELASLRDDVRLVQVHVSGDPAKSLPRAVRREDESWLTWMIGKVNHYADVREPVTDSDGLIAYFRHATDRTAKLLPRLPWPVIVVDADQGPAAVAEAAHDAVRAILDGVGGCHYLS